MSINAPVLVLTAAGLSIIAHGGTVYSQSDVQWLKQGVVAGPVFKFWMAIGVASVGIIAIDNWNHELAVGFAALWIVGGVLVNGKTITTWVGGLGKGLSTK